MVNNRNKDRDKDTESRILEAAKKVFTEKGMHGARMKEIAEEAGINKALLHYYFRSKEQMFDGIFKDILQSFLMPLVETLNKDIPMEKKIEFLVNHYITKFEKDTALPVFIINEMHQNPEKLNIMKEGLQMLTSSKFFQEIKTKHGGGDNNNLAVHRMVNIMALTIFPILAKPILFKLFNMNDERFHEFLNERKTMVPEMVIKSFKSQ